MGKPGKSSPAWWASGLVAGAHLAHLAGRSAGEVSGGRHSDTLEGWPPAVQLATKDQMGLSAIRAAAHLIVYHHFLIFSLLYSFRVAHTTQISDTPKWDI
jgi:hypothetical protein